MPIRPPSPPQFELFEGFAPTIERAPKLALPFQLNETIDVKRACSILHLTSKRLIAMLDKGMIRHYRLAGIKRNPYRIEYSSVVEYCDRLRVHNAISDRRAALKPGQRRRRDSELLPFPISETIGVTEIMRDLGCSPQQALNLIETGTLTAYQILIDTPGSPWRVHRLSLDRYMRQLNQMASKPTTSRYSASSR